MATLAAIEIYNKPNFAYREEAFALLMLNAWELLLKAKWVFDNSEELNSLYELVDNEKGEKVPKPNRSGNPYSHSIHYLSTKLKNNPRSGLEKACHDNILALMEIRDNSAHFINNDIYLGRRVLEIGTASLRNYLFLATEWFNIDFSTYNFFLMPISFFHGFEAAEPVTRAKYPEQIQKLLIYLDELESVAHPEESKQHVALKLETKLSRSSGDSSAIAFRWTDDPAAPAVALREEDILKTYIFTYAILIKTMKRRYSDFLVNKNFHAMCAKLENDKKYVLVRLLNPKNPNCSKQKFYNPNILKVFDNQYTIRKMS